MLPTSRFDRLADSQRTSGGLAWFRAFFTSKLATRILLLAIVAVSFLIWVSPVSPYDTISSKFRAGIGGSQDNTELLPPGHGGPPLRPPPIEEMRPKPPSPPKPAPPPPAPPHGVDDGHSANTSPTKGKMGTTSAEWTNRANAVKSSFKFAWDGYVQYAFGHDEIQPLTNTTALNLNGWGVTVVDSLSTMLLMGLKSEYEKGMEHVRTLKFNTYVSLLFCITLGFNDGSRSREKLIG